MNVLLDGNTHKCIVSCRIVCNLKNFSGCRMNRFDKIRNITACNPRNRTVDCSVWSITFNGLADNRNCRTIERLFSMHKECIKPELGHLVIDVIVVFVGNRNPLWFLCCTACCSIHLWLARKENIFLAMLVAFNKWTKIFIILWCHIFLPEGKKFIITFCSKDVCKVVCLSPFRIFCISKNSAECTG